MSAERDRIIKNSLAAYDNEMDRIRLRYRNQTIPDDGILDATQWLRIYVDCLRVTNDLADATEREQFYRWRNVYQSITDPNPVLGYVKDEILVEGADMENMGRGDGDQKWVEFGVALQNLAKSIHI